MAKRIIPEPYFAYSKDLRKNQTPHEAKLWSRLRAGRFFGLKFKRQVQVGQFIYDFSCRSKMLLIELDGGQHSDIKVARNDLYKKDFAERAGYKVLRFWNNELNDNLEGVLGIIKRECGV